MKKIGITGGMGCGKSTVVAEFVKLGIPAFVADAEGAKLYGDPEFLFEVRALLGDSVFFPDGTADKRKIAAKVFASPELLLGLNAFVHPRVLAAFEDFCLSHADAPYVLFESAILYDYHLDRKVDKVICVYLDLAARLARLQQRDHMSTDEILARIHRQLPAEETMRRADYVILNYEGNPRQRQVAYIDKLIRQ